MRNVSKAPAFEQIDVNADGVMTADEFTEAHRLRISERATQGYRMRGLKNAPSFGELDRDGVVYEAEFLQTQMARRQIGFQ